MSQTTAPGHQGASHPASRRRVATVVVVGVLVALAGGSLLLWGNVASQSRATLTTPAVDAFGISLPSTTPGTPYTFGALPLCLSGEGEAIIDKVDVAEPNAGLHVDAFAVRALSPNLFGAEQVTLAASGFGSGTVVTGACDTARPGSELAVQLSRTRAGDGRTTGLVVTWHAGRRQGTVKVPAHLVLCEGADQNSARCTAL